MVANETFRPADAGDVRLLRWATWTNLNWTGDTRISEAEVDDRPEFRHYWQGFPALGEFGVVVLAEGEPVGVVWVRYSSEGEPSYGYVADDIPELSITVKDGLRGRGLGYRLLEEIEKEALKRGLSGLSLSVEEGNPSRRLYARRGFVPHDVQGSPGTLVKRL